MSRLPRNTRSAMLGFAAGVLVAALATASPVSGQPVPLIQTVDSFPSTGASFGAAVVSIGDRNGDGHDDFAVGDPDAAGDNGRVMLFHGGASVRYRVIHGPSGSRLGTALLVIGDQLFIGAPGYDGDRGMIRVVSLVPGSPTYDILGSTPGDLFGSALAEIADISGDGHSELVIGIPGHRTGPFVSGRFEIRTTAGALLRERNGVPGGNLGCAVASGDLDDDGVPEVVAGSSEAASSGLVNIFEVVPAVTLIEVNAGTGSGDHFGTRVATLRAGDGRDHWVAANARSFGNGRVEVHRLGTGLLATFSDSAHYLGRGLANAGDWDEDGYDELLVGAPLAVYAGGTTGQGYVELISGRNFEVLFHRHGLGLLGSSVAAMGDMDGDRVPEILGGAPEIDPWEGFVEIIHPRVPPARDVVKLTEVSWGNPDGVEITHFGDDLVDLTGWTIVWRTTSGDVVSSPLDTYIQPGESIVVVEATGATFSETPPGIIVLSRFPSLPTTSGEQVVALRNSKGLVIDEVIIAQAGGAMALDGVSGRFRSHVRKMQISTAAAGGVERIWGLDSNAGADWTDQAETSMGLENRSSGPRGEDELDFYGVLLNETTHDPDFVELYNPKPYELDLQGWSLLVSGAQCMAQKAIRPWASSTVMDPWGYYVIGEDARPPECPTAVPYLDLAITDNIPWMTLEYSGALYDGYGRLADLMVTTAQGNQLRHNHPRAPAPVDAFIGAAGRHVLGDAAIGRDPSSTDTDSGADWYALETRSMGTANPPSTYVGHGASLDVRVNGTALGGGLAVIVNAGDGAAGGPYGFAISSTLGPFMGLGPFEVVGEPEFLLDAQGSMRIDLLPGALPDPYDFYMVVGVGSPSGLLYTKPIRFRAWHCPL